MSTILIKLNELKEQLPHMVIELDAILKAREANCPSLSNGKEALKAIDYNQLTVQAVEALKTGISTLWNYFLSQSDIIIELTTESFENLIKAISMKDMDTAIQIVDEALSTVDLDKQAQLLLAEAVELSKKNHTYLQRIQTLLTNGLAGAVTAMAAVFTGA
jgi:hypothetical protein